VELPPPLLLLPPEDPLPDPEPPPLPDPVPSDPASPPPRVVVDPPQASATHATVVAAREARHIMVTRMAVLLDQGGQVGCPAVGVKQ
jgi:hypothetical protein